MPTKEQISHNMRSNKSKDTRPELMLRKELWHRGLRYRKNYKAVFGSPDVAFTRVRIAVFVDGDMWHGHDWENLQKRFKNNRDFWISKIERNMKHDSEVNMRLSESGWTVIRFWDFEIKKDVEACADKIEKTYIEKILSDSP